MSQIGYGHSDAVGAPFDFYAGANVVTGTTIAMQTASLVLAAAGTTAALTVTLPLNPTDGCVAEISSTQIVTSLTVNANTNDSIVNGVLTAVTALTPTALATAGVATATIKYKYSLNGSQVGNAAPINARTWVRVQ
jgi:hypothetical protein